MAQEKNIPMRDEIPIPPLTDAERDQYRLRLQSASNIAADYDGSEAAYSLIESPITNELAANKENHLVRISDDETKVLKECGRKPDHRRLKNSSNYSIQNFP